MILYRYLGSHWIDTIRDVRLNFGKGNNKSFVGKGF